MAAYRGFIRTKEENDHRQAIKQDLIKNCGLTAMEADYLLDVHNMAPDRIKMHIECVVRREDCLICQAKRGIESQDRC